MKSGNHIIWRSKEIDEGKKGGREGKEERMKGGKEGREKQH